MAEDYMCKETFKASFVGRVSSILLINVDWNFLLAVNNAKVTYQLQANSVWLILKLVNLQHCCCFCLHFWFFTLGLGILLKIAQDHKKIHSLYRLSGLILTLKWPSYPFLPVCLHNNVVCNHFTLIFFNYYLFIHTFSFLSQNNSLRKASSFFSADELIACWCGDIAAKPTWWWENCQSIPCMERRTIAWQA